MRIHTAFKGSFLCLTCMFAYAFAGPEGGSVASGDVSIQGQGTGQVVVNQSTNKAIINWQTFNVGNGESVKFVTPGANAATLNRVVGQSPSEILGSVSSNGQFWLINPNGIMFGQNAQVNVAGMVASTLNITDENFLKGNYSFEQQGGNLAKIVNQGHINADGGYVAMMAPQIENTGIVEAKLGTVAMGAGTKATLEFQGNQLLHFAINDGADVPMYDEDGKAVAALNQAGSIQANGGNVILTADSINSMLDQSINVVGVIKADTVEDRPGKIVLFAKGNTILNNATLSAQGNNPGEVGGSIKVMGQNVGLAGNTTVNASGAAGGGDIRIGYDNRDPNGPEANMTVVGSGVGLKAEATQSGDGGYIETSGKVLDVQTGNVSTLGANGGQNGTWLLDPWNLTISVNSNFNPDNPSGSPFEPTGENSNLNVTTLTTALAGGNVVVQTGTGPIEGNGDITVSDDVAWSSGSSLTLTAYGSIILKARLIGTDSGDPIGAPNATVNLTAQHGSINDNGRVGSIIAANTKLTAGSGIDDTSSYIDLQNTSNQFGTLTATAYGQDGSNNGITVVDGNTSDIILNNINTYAANANLSVTASGAMVQANGVIATNGGAVTINAAGDFSQSADGSITTGSGDTWGNVTINAGTGSGVGAGAMTMAGRIDGNALTIASGANSNGNITQSGFWTSYDTSPSSSSISILNYGTGDIIQTTEGTIGLTFPDSRNIGVALTALNGDIQQVGGISAQQSRVTLNSELGNITQSNGTSNLGYITAGSTTILGANGAKVDLSGGNSLGLLVGSNAGDLTINDTNSNGLGIDTLTVADNLAITAQSISETESGAYGIHMTGTGKTANFVVASGGAVSLMNHPGGNDFGGNAVSVSGANGSAAGTVNIVDSNDVGLVLGPVTSGALTATAGNGLTLSGDIATTGDVLLTANGNSNTLTDDVLNLAGHTINAGSNTVTLTNNNTILYPSDLAINLTGNIAAGALNVSTTLGDIQQDSGGTITAGATTIQVTSIGQGNITLLGDMNLGGDLTISGGDLHLLGAIDDSGHTANLTAVGPITQTNELGDTTGSLITTNANLSSGASDGHVTGAYIDLSNPNNQIGTLAAVAYGDPAGTLNQLVINVNNSNSSGLNLNNITSFGNVSINSSTGITQNVGTTLQTIENPNDSMAYNISLSAGGVITLQGNINVYSNVDRPGNLSLTTTDANINQSAGHIILSGGNGTTTINAGTSSINLSSATNHFTGAVTASGNNITLVQNGTLSLGNILASGNVVLAATHLNNTGGANAITLGTGKTWQIYLTNLSGNTFGGLNSGNQAIWGTSYPTSISQSGNRYIFGTSENLTLSPITGSLALTGTVGTASVLPTPINGTNYNVTGFVVASTYDNVFIQDTVANTLGDSLSFTSPGTSTVAPAGTYNVSMNAPASTSTGYTIITQDPYGTLTLAANGNGSTTDGPQLSPNVVNNPALFTKNIENTLPKTTNNGQLPAPITQDTINKDGAGQNSDLKSLPL